VTLRDRDKKLLMGIVPLVVIIAYWMLFLSPKRDEASKAGKDLTAAQQKRDEALARAGQLTQAKESYASDYETVVRLGKAIPTSVDMPSLLVQLDRAARGTGIDFTKIKAGERGSAATPANSAPASGGAPAGGNASSGGPAGASSAPPTAAGGQQAQSAPGQAAEKANNAASTANGASSAAAGTSGDTNTQTSQNVSGGKGLPVGGGDTSAAAGGTGSGAPGLDTVPLDFEFNGSFFDLADFFHRMKRFVHVVNDHIQVRGRLMTVDTITFTSEDFPSLKAQVRATVYLTPKDEGVTAGATPEGPAEATPGSGGSSTPPGQTASGSAPTATVVPR
jgi:Tfp pilus assembly protein PilO